MVAGERMPPEVLPDQPGAHDGGVPEWVHPDELAEGLAADGGPANEGSPEAAVLEPDDGNDGVEAVESAGAEHPVNGTPVQLEGDEQRMPDQDRVWAPIEARSPAEEGSDLAEDPEPAATLAVNGAGGPVGPAPEPSVQQGGTGAPELVPDSLPGPVADADTEGAAAPAPGGEAGPDTAVPAEVGAEDLTGYELGAGGTAAPRPAGGSVDAPEAAAAAPPPAAPDPVIEQRLAVLRAVSGEAVAIIEALRGQAAAASAIMDTLRQCSEAAAAAAVEFSRARGAVQAAVQGAEDAQERAIESVGAIATMERESGERVAASAATWPAAVEEADKRAARFLAKSLRRRAILSWSLWMRPAVAIGIAMAMAAIIAAAIAWGIGELLARRVASLERQRELLGAPVRSVRAEEWGVSFFERPSDGRRHIALPPGVGVGAAWTHRGRAVIELPPD